MKSVEDPAVLEARRKRVEENIKNKYEPEPWPYPRQSEIDLERGRRENWEARKTQQQKEYNWFVAKFFMVMIPLFLVGACTYNVATTEIPEPNYITNLPVQDCFPRCNR